MVSLPSKPASCRISATKVSVVNRPHAQCVARLIADTGTAQIDFDVLHVFFGIARGDFFGAPIKRRCRVFGIDRAGFDHGSAAAGSRGGGTAGRSCQIGHQFGGAGDPSIGGGLEVQIANAYIGQPFGALFGKISIQIFTGLAETLVLNHLY